MQNKKSTAVLIGNPNCGKTTLFNRLTGSHQFVGNWSGVTVEKKSGKLQNHKKESIEIIDLPGIYSLSPYSPEEIVAKNCLVHDKPSLVINIIDATNLERNLYLTTQILELNIPTIIALNMYDIIEKNGSVIDINELSKQLNTVVIPISANKGKGISELTNTIISLAKSKDTPHFDKEFSTPKERYSYINYILKSVTQHTSRSKLSDKTDRIFTNKYFALPLFLGIIFLIFSVTFGKFGTFLRDNAQWFITDFLGEKLQLLLTLTDTSDWAKSLVLDGIVNGLGSVISFLPQIALLFTALSLLEDSGYMSRTAFILDKPLRKIGLSGKAFMPLLMGFGCTVPSILSTRTLENQRDKRLTILIAPFMSCSAKMPVYLLFISYFFPSCGALIIFLLYAIGIGMAVFTASIFKLKICNKDTFILELPPYRIPSPKSLVMHIWIRIKDFLVRAGTILFGATILIWFLKSFDTSLQYVSAENSMLSVFGKLISPIFSICGFDDWRASVSLVIGITAKESVASTLGVLFSNANILTAFTPLSAFSFLVFVLLYPPCVATLSAIYKETHSIKHTAFCVVYQTFVAWILSALIFQFGTLLLNFGGVL